MQTEGRSREREQTKGMSRTSGRRHGEPASSSSSTLDPSTCMQDGCTSPCARRHPVCAPPLAVRPGWTEARFCFFTSFACRSSSGRRLLDDGSVRLRVTVTIEFDREGGVSTPGDRLPPSTGDFSAFVHMHMSRGSHQSGASLGNSRPSDTGTHRQSVLSSFVSARGVWAHRG